MIVLFILFLILFFSFNKIENFSVEGYPGISVPDVPFDFDWYLKKEAFNSINSTDYLPFADFIRTGTPSELTDKEKEAFKTLVLNKLSFYSLQGSGNISTFGDVYRNLI